jgi:hypothetical protein
VCARPSHEPGTAESADGPRAQRRVDVSKREIFRTTVRMPEELMTLICRFKPNCTINEFICQAVQRYCEQLERKEIDKQFEVMNSREQRA